jgi:hypothetical protein
MSFIELILRTIFYFIIIKELTIFNFAIHKFSIFKKYFYFNILITIKLMWQKYKLLVDNR